ncbi:MAG: DUF167 domain-containing protein [Candidatus Methanoplasma sp.]|jgi:uncharacterized protein (TIGR00251 family)|nr:DUF167 domain-containing protein [Candidatus Methanoplasma sp.]
MSVDEAVRTRDSGVEVDVLVSPRSGRSGIEGTDGWRKRVIVKVKAPPLDGKANREVEEVFSRYTGLPSSVISGQTNRQKTVFIKGDASAIISKLREQIE